MLNDLYLDKYIPVKYHMNWPVYHQYQIFTLREYINFCSSNNWGTLSEDDWEHLQQQFGNSDDPVDPLGNALDSHHVIFVKNDNIKKTYNPFNDISQDIIPDIFTILLENAYEKKVAAIFNWVQRYGLPFKNQITYTLPGLAEPCAESKELILSALSIESMLQKRFYRYAMLTSHFIGNLREFNAIYKLMEQLCKNTLCGINWDELNYMRENSNSGDNTTLSLEEAHKFLKDKMTQYIKTCTLTLEDFQDNTPEPDKVTPLLLLCIEPNDLMSALWLKINLDVMKYGNLAFCNICGRPFPKNRKEKKYCSIKCGNLYRKRQQRERQQRENLSMD